MFGHSYEICGEMGFGWCRRLMLMHQILASDAGGENALLEIARRLGKRYRYSAAAAVEARGRIEQVLRLLSARLLQQRTKGSRYFVGSVLSARQSVFWDVSERTPTGSFCWKG